MVKKKAVKLNDIFDIDWWTGTPSVVFNFTYESHLFEHEEEIEGVKTIVKDEFDIFPDTKFFLDELMYHYGERFIFMMDDDSNKNLHLYYLIQEFYNSIGSNLADIIGSFQIAYDPTHNYDGREVRTINHDLVHGKTDTNTETHDGDITDESLGYYGVDGTASPADTEKRSTERKGTRTLTVASTGTDTDTTTDTLIRGGNLGLTTNAQLLTGDAQLRMRNLYMEFIKLFVDEMTFYF